MGAVYGLFCSFVRQRPARSGSLHLVWSFVEFIVAAAAVFYATNTYFELAGQSASAGLPRPFWTAAYIGLLAAAFILVLLFLLLGGVLLDASAGVDFSPY